MNNTTIIILALLAVSPTVFWILFFYFNSRTKTLSNQALVATFLVGAVGTFVALLLERIAFHFLPTDLTAIVFGQSELKNLTDVFLIFGVSFFFIALIEEVVKFEILRVFISRIKTCDQIIDFVKLGIAVGLGFATTENLYYFFMFHWDEVWALTSVFVSRFFLTTLAHIIYGAVLGYYLGHAACNKVYEEAFIKKAIFSAVLLHGIFNFLIFTGAAFYNVLLVAGVLIILIKWFKDRRLLDSTVNISEADVISKPLLFDPLEMKSILYSKNVSENQQQIILKKLKFCPYCLTKLNSKEEFCPRCHKPMRS